MLRIRRLSQRFPDADFSLPLTIVSSSRFDRPSPQRNFWKIHKNGLLLNLFVKAGHLLIEMTVMHVLFAKLCKFAKQGFAKPGGLLYRLRARADQNAVGIGIQKTHLSKIIHI